MKTLRAAALVGCLLTAWTEITAQQQKVPPQAAATNSAVVRKPEQEIVYQGRERAWLGVTLSEDNKGHVWIHSVIAGSPADWAHLRPHDQIVAMDETPIHSYADAVRFINSKRPDEEITVAIQRDGVPGGGLTAVLAPARGAPSGAPARAGTGANTTEAIPGQPGRLEQIVYQGREQARLGVTLSEDNKGHVWIRSVIAGSPADWALLRPGDQIVAMDETPIHSYADAVRFIDSKRPDEEIAVAIQRDGESGGVTAVLGPARSSSPTR